MSACQKIDEMNIGMVKSSVFFQLLDCMDFNLSSEQRQDMLTHFGVKSHGQTFIKYQALIKSLAFEKATSKWAAQNSKQPDSVSTADATRYSTLNVKKNSLTQSIESIGRKSNCNN